jgi:hypothetical protein
MLIYLWLSIVVIQLALLQKNCYPVTYSEPQYVDLGNVHLPIWRLAVDSGARLGEKKTDYRPCRGMFLPFCYR